MTGLEPRGRSAPNFGHCAPFSSIRLQDLFSQPQRFRRDLNELIVGDEFNSLLKIEIAVWNQPNCYVGSRSPHVGQLLLAHNVDVKVRVFSVLPDDHAFVNVDAGPDEERAALLQIVESVGGRKSGTVGDQRAGWTMRNFALPLDVSIKKRIHDDGATRVGKQSAAQSNEPAAGHAEFDAHAPVAVIVHVGDFAFARANVLHDHADKFFGDIDAEVFNGLHQFAVFFIALGDNLRLADHELVALATHHLDQNGELQLAAPKNLE